MFGKKQQQKKHFFLFFFFNVFSLDPSIQPVPMLEVDPTVFEKRFLKKIRDLGEVFTLCVCLCLFVCEYVVFKFMNKLLI